MADPNFKKPEHPYPHEDFVKLVNSMPDSDPFSSVKGRLLEISKGDWHQATVHMDPIKWKSKGKTKDMRPTKALVKALEILLLDINDKLDKHLNNVVTIVNAIEAFLKGPLYVTLTKMTQSASPAVQCLRSSLLALPHRSWDQLGYEPLKVFETRLKSLLKEGKARESKGELEEHMENMVNFVEDLEEYCNQTLGPPWKRLWNAHAEPDKRVWQYDVEEIEAEERAQLARAARSHSLSHSRFQPLSRASLSSTTYGQTAL